ncbi:MAG: hypothetical protein KAS32_19055 [Candidatus Peribacteraceae bacterium]|nr:hypothetical protein [Candidatus Peribacteraceae bacterium]
MELLDNKFKKETADPQANTSILDDIFDVAPDGNMVNISTGEIVDEVKGMRKELKELEKEIPDVDGIIVSNIDRANRLLDKIENDITGDRGTYTASLIEACGKLIDTVTSAANSITGMSQHSDTIRQKERALDIQEKKVMLAGIVKGAENVTVNNNNLTMNREDLMKMIRDEKKS